VLASLMRLRRAAARIDPLAVQLARPVISVGNLSVGGRGKTPVCALVAQLLVDAGERPAILTRGYGRKLVADGVTVVSNGQEIVGSLDESGDEPLMLAHAVPRAVVLVAEQRAIAGTLAETAFGCTVHILDDGFQHHQLKRDIDIVLVAEDDLTDRVLPFGRLREPLDALDDADAVVVASEVCRAACSAGRPNRRIFQLDQHLGEPVSLGVDTGWMKSKPPVVAAAGIAGPDRFFDSLKGAGWTVTDAIAFADHHRFNAGDIRRVGEAIIRTGAAGLVTTTKDAMRLAPFAPLPFAAAHVPLETQVTPGDEFRFWLLTALAEARA
jgi:tetraacyldisaccharide 4'-kinase